ncbi:MAG: enoyl-CoA hydratase/isomerase family protein [Bacillota bacterium]|nr:enoyl-CoA hydratase/isomerase family protein [Bacillota bacterium]
MHKWREQYRRLLLEEPEEGLLEIVFHTPKTRNSLDGEAHAELSRIWKDIHLDPSIRVVLVRGSGGHFSSGGDFSLVEAIASDYATRERLWWETRDLVQNLLDCSKPVVAAVEGVAVGAGLAVVMLADISVVSKSARLLDGHTRLGVAAGDHAVLTWPLLMGMARAKYHLLLNEPIRGEEAASYGLVSLAVEEEEVLPKARELARRLLQGAPSALRFTKYALNGWWRAHGPIFDTSTALEFLGFTGPELQEGLRSHREKRPPRF